MFDYLLFFEDVLWNYLGFPFLLGLGVYFSFKTRCVQIRQFPQVVRTFIGFMREKPEGERGVHPLRAFFACVGGCVGVGNVVGICTAVQVGGPGALFWIWVTALVGMMIKYAEVYLGIRYRVPNQDGGYDGGPMYYLQKAFRSSFIPSITAILLCIYGVEVFQFGVVVRSVSDNWGVDLYGVTALLLGLVLFASSGGVYRVGAVATMLIPIFVGLYLAMGSWVLWQHMALLPQVFKTVFYSAFTGHAAVGGFIGSTLLTTVSQGIRRGCYTADIAVGYASVINSETSAHSAQKQASLEFLGIGVDTFFVCTTSVLLILVTGVWHQPLAPGVLVQTALATSFGYMHFFMPLFLFLLGYTTINAYFLTGLKCAKYLHPRYGKPVFYVYAIAALSIFSFVDVAQAQALMAVAGGLLLVINALGIYRLRHEVDFSFERYAAQEVVLVSDSAS